MGTLPASGPLSYDKVAVGVSFTQGQVYIRHSNENAKVAIYDFWGIGAVVGASVNLGQLWSSENSFVSEVDRSCAFSGTVSITEGPGIQVVGGYSSCQYCTWLSGQDPKVAGTLCVGGGASIGVAVGISVVSGQICRLNYVGYRVLPWLVNPDQGDKF